MAASHQRLIVVLTSRLRRAAEICWAPGYLILFAAILIFQLFIPPSIGLADNADSSRLTYNAGLTPNYPVNERYFWYFTPDYLKVDVASRKVAVPFWTGRLAFLVAEWLGSFKTAGHFDIRWLGFVHMWLYLLCFSLFLLSVRRSPGLVRWIVPALAIWIFGDVFYVAYLNSLYLDAMGVICFLLMMVGLISIFDGDPPVWAVGLFLISAVGLAASKPLNAPVALMAGVFVALVRFRPVLIALGTLVVALAVLFIARTPTWYQYPSLVDVVMVRIAREPEAVRAIADFGLLPKDLRFTGKDAFRADGPRADPGFQSRFRHNTARSLAEWYLGHPATALRYLREDLVNSAPNLRPVGDMEKIYSPPGAKSRSRSFCSWSDLRAGILYSWPIVTPVFYAGVILVAGWFLIRRRWSFGGLLLFLACIGITQFGSASLFDVNETPRHLFMFHVSTDVLILMTTAGMLQTISSGRKLRAGTAYLPIPAAPLDASDAAATAHPTSLRTSADFS